MGNHKHISCLSILLSLLISGVVFAEEAQDLQEEFPESWTPFQFAVFEPYQLFDSSTSVGGLRMNLFYGYNRNMRGFDIGLGNAANSLVGMQIGLVNSSEKTGGVQIGLGNGASWNSQALQVGLYNGAGEEFVGVQIGVLNDTTSLAYKENRAWGMQIGVINAGLFPPGVPREDSKTLISTTVFHGVELGVFNAKREVRGLSVGVFNAAREIRGLQVGLVNFSEHVSGLQIGLLNYNREGIIPFFPVLNGGW